jgi:hypothetical protein
MQTKFEETNALLQAVLNLQKDTGGRSTWCLSWWCLLPSLLLHCPNSKLYRCWNYVHSVVGNLCPPYVHQLVCWNFVWWNLELVNCVMFEAVRNVLCFGVYVDDGFVVMCVLLDLWWESWKICAHGMKFILWQQWVISKCLGNGWQAYITWHNIVIMNSA